MTQNLLTREQWAQNPASRKPGATYEGMVSWVTKTRARRAAARLAAAPDALAPTPESAITAVPAAYQPTPPAAVPAAYQPTPDNVLGEQVSQNVHSQLDPLIAEIMRSTAQQAGQIGGLTDTYAARLAPFEGAAKERYATAAAGSAGVAQSLADRMSGAGTDAGAGLRAKLEAINAPGALVENIAGGAADFGRNAGNAGYSTDASALQELIAAGATAQNYAGALPGLARLEGQQQVGRAQGEGQRQIGEVRSRIPGMTADLLAGARATELQKAGLAADFVSGNRDTELKKAELAAGLTESARNREVTKATVRTSREIGLQKSEADRLKAEADAKAAADKSAQSWQKIQQTGDRLKLQAGNASFNQGIAAARVNLSQDQYGLALQREARLAKGKGKGGFTAAQLVDMQATAYDTALSAFQGSYRDKNGNQVTIDRKSATEVLNDLLGHGTPLSIALKAVKRLGSRPDAPPDWQVATGWIK
jgi:hypothetical protein